MAASANKSHLFIATYLTGIIVSLLAIIGYAYDVHALYKVTPYSSMAIHTSCCFLLLGAGIISLMPQSGIVGAFNSRSLGGISARRMLPAAIGVPFLLGAACLSGQPRRVV